MSQSIADIVTAQNPPLHNRRALLLVPRISRADAVVHSALLAANIDFIRVQLRHGLGKVLITTGKVALQIRHSHKTAKYVLTRLLAYAKYEPCQDHP